MNEIAKYNPNSTHYIGAVARVSVLGNLSKDLDLGLAKIRSGYTS